jgi:hypothetical protein
MYLLSLVQKLVADSCTLTIHGYPFSAPVGARGLAEVTPLPLLCKDLMLGSERVLLVLFGSEPVLLQIQQGGR